MSVIQLGWAKLAILCLCLSTFMDGAVAQTPNNTPEISLPLAAVATQSSVSQGALTPSSSSPPNNSTFTQEVTDQWAKEQDLGKSSSDICVSIHLFNTQADVRNETLQVTDSLPSSTHVYVHLDRHSSTFEAEYAETQRRGFISVVSDENRGCDIGGKLLTIAEMQEKADPCKFVLFVHSKSEPGRRRELLSIASTPQKAQEALKLLRDPNQKVGMVGPESCTHIGDCIADASCRSMSDVALHMKLEREINGPTISLLLQKLGLGQPNWDQAYNSGYVTGSMFWMRRDILDKVLQSYGTRKLYSELSIGYTRGSNGKMEHALERVFGHMVTDSGWEVAWIPTGFASEKCAQCNTLPSDMRHLPACEQCSHEPPPKQPTVSATADSPSPGQLRAYGKRYRDLQVLGGNVDKLRAHWHRFGKFEGRIIKAHE